MGYRTVQRVPRDVFTFAHAKEIHDNSKPIRGHAQERRPLGARRDYSTYSVRMNKVGDADVVEFMLYETPLITYYPDDTIGLRNGGMNSVSVNQMLWQVLRLSSNNSRGRTIVRINDTQHVLGQLGYQGETMRLKATTPNNPTSAKNLTFVSHRDSYGYVINKQRMREVRAKHSEFLEYLKGFVKIRSEPIAKNYGRHTVEYNRIAWTAAELAEHFPTQRREHFVYIDMGYWDCIRTLPGEMRYHYKPREESALMYEMHTPKFIALTLNGQAEDVAHKNFHKAAMILMTYGHNAIPADEHSLTNVLDSSVELVDTFDKVMKRWYRSTILERVVLKNGQAPNTMYEQWMQD